MTEAVQLAVISNLSNIITAFGAFVIAAASVLSLVLNWLTARKTARHGKEIAASKDQITDAAFNAYAASLAAGEAQTAARHAHQKMKILDDFVISTIPELDKRRWDQRKADTNYGALD